MYNTRKPNPSLLRRNVTYEAESLEVKVQRLMKNKEPIPGERPLIYTERKDGVLKAYNIRTDRWEIAAEAMDVVTKSRIAQRDSKGDPKVIDLNGDKKDDGGAKSTHGNAD